LNDLHCQVIPLYSCDNVQAVAKKVFQGSAAVVSKSSGGISYEDVSESFQTGRLERELQMVQLSAIRCSCIAIL
jgi:hypothetical protein